MRFAKKLHYCVKYLIISLPVLFLLLSLIIKDAYNNQFFGNLLSFFEGFTDCPINAWYYDFLSLIFDSSSSFTSDYNFISYLLYYPLWVFYVYAFDIVLDVLIFIPKLMHSFFEKLGGGEN